MLSFLLSVHTYLGVPFLFTIDFPLCCSLPAHGDCDGLNKNDPQRPVASSTVRGVALLEEVHH